MNPLAFRPRSGKGPLTSDKKQFFDPEWQGSRFLPARSVDSAIRWRHTPVPERGSGREAVSCSSQLLRSWAPSPRSSPPKYSFQRLLRNCRAAGLRTRETGALANVGTNGYYWSSSSRLAGDNNAGNLNFNSGNVNPLNWNNRANGFSVRCVQHLRLFFCRSGLFDTLQS